MNNRLEVRCFCHRNTLLAICGRDQKDGIPFIHIKTVKNRHITTEVIITSGTARIRCRECLRWHTIRIRISDIAIKTEQLPSSILV